jgi:hypothetical protein
LHASRRLLALLTAAFALVAIAAVTQASAGSGGGTGVYGTPTVSPQPIDDNSLKVEMTTVDGGAPVVPTSRTIPHWHGTATDPNNGITYGFNMAGADPACSHTDCSITVQADITPLIVNVGGMTFDGTAVLGPTLASPQFATNDYGATPAATAAGSFPFAPALIRGPGGALSQRDAGRLLQLEDATMRAQFNKNGPRYHLMLHPNVMAAVTINVPSSEGTLIVSGRGVIGADVNINWWSAQIKKLQNSADPTHLPIYLTNQVLNFLDGDPSNCCVIGFHGSENPTSPSGGGGANKKVQTFAWASWIQPGFYARPDGGTDWAVQDIHALSHEISEWADDPFVNNFVEPWLTPTAPQYGCTGILETGDPVVGIGFAMGANAFEQGPNPNGTQSADGYYHPEDEVFSPWFFRTSPNTVSEPTQSPSANIGRYTLMGDLNPFPGFRQPATGC